jgi:hypothetical protein
LTFNRTLVQEYINLNRLLVGDTHPTLDL